MIYRWKKEKYETQQLNQDFPGPYVGGRERWVDFRQFGICAQGNGGSGGDRRRSGGRGGGAKGGREVLVVESAPTFGTGSSSRNSEVIDAGIYYPPNSLKASLCVRGRHLLYDYCRAHGIPHKQIGKLIVATRPSEVPKLSELMSRGLENGVQGLKMMDGEEAMRVEPQLYCTKALMSPVSGIIDTHSLMLSLLSRIDRNVAFRGKLRAMEPSSLTILVSLVVDTREAGCSSTFVRLWDGASPLKPDLILSPRIVVNSADLGALPLARRIHGLDDGIVPTPYFARGCYFTLGSPPFQHLIYPLPEDGGLGVHVTLDLNGQVKFEWIDGVDGISNFLNLERRFMAYDLFGIELQSML